MKTYVLVGLLIMQSVTLHAQKNGVDKMIGDFFAHPEKANVSNLSPNDRDELVRKLRLYAEGKPPNTTLSEYRGETMFLLIRFDDPETVNKFMDAYNDEAQETGVVSDDIGYKVPRLPGYCWEDAAQPLLIPRFAEYLSVEDGNQLGFQGGDAPYLVCPRSIGSARIIVGTIKNCPDFDVATRDWAKRTYEFLEYSAYRVNVAKFRKIMVDWWSANKEYFDKKDYKSVKPGANPYLASLATPTPDASPAKHLKQ